MILKNIFFRYLNLLLIFFASSSTIFTIQDIKYKEEFENLLYSNKGINVVFLEMNNCPHCKVVAPHFEKITKNNSYKTINFYKANGPNLEAHTYVKSQVDPETKKPIINPDTGKPFAIPGYPSFIIQANGKLHAIVIGGNIKLLEEKIKKLL